MESTASRGTMTATGRVTRGVLQRLSSRDCQDSRNCCRAPATHSCRLGAVVLVSAAALPELEAPTQALGEAVAGPPPGLSAAASLGLRGGGEQQMADHRQVQPPASPRIFAAQGLRALLEFRIFHHAQSSGWPTTGRCNRLSLHPPREGWPEEGRGGAEERILGSKRPACRGVGLRSSDCQCQNPEAHWTGRSSDCQECFHSLAGASAYRGVSKPMQPSQPVGFKTPQCVEMPEEDPWLRWGICVLRRHEINEAHSSQGPEGPGGGANGLRWEGKGPLDNLPVRVEPSEELAKRGRGDRVPRGLEEGPTARNGQEEDPWSWGTTGRHGDENQGPAKQHGGGRFQGIQDRTGGRRIRKIHVKNTENSRKNTENSSQK